jgi:hypothetical protein
MSCTPFTSPKIGKKRAEQAGTLRFKYPWHKRNTVIEAGIRGKIIQRSGCSTLGVVATENNCWNSRKNDGPHAHNAGLQCNIQGTIQKPPGVYLPGGFSDRYQFSVCRRILRVFTQVISTGDYYFVPYNDAADRDLGFCLGLMSLTDRPGHPIFVAALQN